VKWSTIKMARPLRIIGRAQAGEEQDGRRVRGERGSFVNLRGIVPIFGFGRSMLGNGGLMLGPSSSRKKFPRRGESIAVLCISKFQVFVELWPF
jgi:hypothetical protein